MKYIIKHLAGTRPGLSHAGKQGGYLTAYVLDYVGNFAEWTGDRRKAIQFSSLEVAKQVSQSAWERSACSESTTALVTRKGRVRAAW